MVRVIIGRCTAAGAGFRASVLGIRILAPCTGGIGMRTVFRSAVSAGAAGGRSAMLTGRRIAPRAVAHAVAGVFVIRIAAIPAVRFAPVL